MSQQFTYQDVMKRYQDLVNYKAGLEREAQIYNSTNPMYVQQTVLPKYNQCLEEINRVENYLRSINNNVNMFANNARNNALNTNSVGFGTPMAGFQPNAADSPFGGSDVEDLISDEEIEKVTKARDGLRTLSSCMAEYGRATSPEMVIKTGEYEALKEENIKLRRIVDMSGVQDFSGMKLVCESVNVPFLMDDSIKDKVSLTTTMVGGKIAYGVSLVDPNFGVEEYKSIMKSECNRVASKELEISSISFDEDDGRKTIEDAVNKVIYGIATIADENSDIFQTESIIKSSHIVGMVEKKDRTGLVSEEEVIESFDGLVEDVRSALNSGLSASDILAGLKKVVGDRRNREGTGSEDLDRVITNTYKFISTSLENIINKIYSVLLNKGSDLIVGGMDEETVDFIVDEFKGVNRLGLSDEECSLFREYFISMVSDLFETLTLTTDPFTAESIEDRTGYFAGREDKVFFLYSRNICESYGLPSTNNISGDIPNVIDKSNLDKFKVTSESYPDLYAVLKACSLEVNTPKNEWRMFRFATVSDTKTQSFSVMPYNGGYYLERI